MNLEIKGDIVIKKNPIDDMRQLVISPDVWAECGKIADKMNVNRKKLTGVLLKMAIEKVKLVD